MGRSVVGHELTADDLDWLGIHATRLNAHLIRTIFRDIAHPFILRHYDIIRRVSEPVVAASGWKPGWSTDYCNALICEDYDIKTVISLSSVDSVYDKDPRKKNNATPISKMTWDEFRGLVGDKWIPETHFPFDPIAAKKAQELKLTVAVMKGDNFKNVENFLEGKEFMGTTITG